MPAQCPVMDPETDRPARCIYPLDHSGDHSFAPLDLRTHLVVDADAIAQAIHGHAPELADELAAWWRGRAEAEIDATVAKATEYSGTLGGLPQDLVDFGRQIAFVQRREHEFTDQELAEFGVWAYIVGKVNRWSSALRNGRMVSDDTLLDLGIYVRIAQHIRERGTWP